MANKIITGEEFNKVGGIVGRGVTSASGGRQEYSDGSGNTYYRNERNIGTPQYASDYEVVSAAPTPATATTPPSYSRYDKGIVDTNAAIASTTGTAPDLAAIKAEKQSQADAMIKEIQAQFQTALAAENQAGGARNDRVRALNNNSGLGGSTFASSNAQNQEDKNKKVVDLMTAENNAKVNSILAGVDDRASAAYKEQLATYRTSLEGDLNRQRDLKDEQRKQALETFTGLASAGVTLDMLKNTEPDVYRQLQEEFGGTDLELKAAYNNALPSEMRTQYTTQTIKGANGNAVIHRYGINPLTKKLEQEDFDTGAKYDVFTNSGGSEIKEYGGTLYRVSKDGATLTKLDASLQPTQKSTTTTKIPTATVQQFEDILNDTTKDESGYSTMGDDGYVDPSQYQNALSRWTELGGLRNDFLKQFPPANYINPASNNTLPTYMRNLKNQPTKKSSASEDLLKALGAE